MPLLSYVARRVIDIYQFTLGPHLGGRCRFEPSCSRYAREALECHGPFKGSWLAFARLIKCGPWHPGGLDPVPPSKGFSVRAAVVGRQQASPDQSGC